MTLKSLPSPDSYEPAGDFYRNLSSILRHAGEEELDVVRSVLVSPNKQVPADQLPHLYRAWQKIAGGLEPSPQSRLVFHGVYDMMLRIQADAHHADFVSKSRYAEFHQFIGELFGREGEYPKVKRLKRTDDWYQRTRYWRYPDQEAAVRHLIVNLRSQFRFEAEGQRIDIPLKVEDWSDAEAAICLMKALGVTRHVLESFFPDAPQLTGHSRAASPASLRPVDSAHFVGLLGSKPGNKRVLSPEVGDGKALMRLSAQHPYVEFMGLSASPQNLLQILNQAALRNLAPGQFWVSHQSPGKPFALFKDDSVDVALMQAGAFAHLPEVVRVLKGDGKIWWDLGEDGMSTEELRQHLKNLENRTGGRFTEMAMTANRLPDGVLAFQVEKFDRLTPPLKPESGKRLLVAPFMPRRGTFMRGVKSPARA